MTIREGAPLEQALDLLSPGRQASPKDLLALLREEAPLYRGLARSTADGLRAFVLSRLAGAGLSERLIPFALEELRTAQSPAGPVAAARVLLAIPHIPALALPALREAIERLQLLDRPVDLDRFPPRPGEGTSALAELTTALAVLESLPSCCGGLSDEPPPDPHPPSDSLSDLTDLAMEDQSGRLTTFGAATGGRVCLLAFFYTRCTNPLKCSRTVSLLSEQDALLRDAGAGGYRMIGITYEPQYDTSARLHAYGRDRGLVFGETCALLRTCGPIGPLRETLGLGVGFGQSSVNAHRLEWLLTDRGGSVARVGARAHWEPDVLCETIHHLCSDNSERPVA